MDHPLIGTLRERSLHAALKAHFARPGDLVEVPVAGYVVDIVRPGGPGEPDPCRPGPERFVEIQTGNFGALKAKLPALLAVGPVRVVYPIPRVTSITVIDRDGEVLRSRKSPRRGCLEDVFVELVSIPELCLLPGLDFEIVLVDVEEIRREGVMRRGRMRVRRLDRRLVALGERLVLGAPEDYRRLAAVPEGAFTTADLAASMHRPRWLAQKAAYCLRRMSLVRPVGFRARSVLYEAA